MTKASEFNMHHIERTNKLFSAYKAAKRSKPFLSCTNEERLYLKRLRKLAFASHRLAFEY